MVVSLLGDPMLTVVTSLVIVPLIVFVATVGLIIILRVILSPSRSVEEAERLRYMRYEAGNLPRPGSAKGKVSMQYLGYLIMFLAVEPAVILLAVVLVAPRQLYFDLALLYAFLIAVYAPLLYYGIKVSRRIDLWSLEEG